MNHSVFWSEKYFLILASEAFFDNLTVEQEFMTGVDTDKVCKNNKFLHI